MTTTQGLNLLVVDDEPDMVSSLQRILKARGFAVEIANSGEEAVTWARDHEPDGILIDIKMPGMNGVEAVRKIRAHRPDVFVVFMTGCSELVQEAEAEAEAEGSVAVLSKPVDPGQVCALFEEAC
ncbi:MAG: response regulator [Verrucomicrobiaceae bacterium]|nr:response regulator [Verrucomicrobiaceae bacterium]